jgi:hypothetical protein
MRHSEAKESALDSHIARVQSSLDEDRKTMSKNGDPRRVWVIVLMFIMAVVCATVFLLFRLDVLPPTG